MQAIKIISTGVMPVMLISIVGYGLIKGINVFDAFLSGAKDGMKTAVKILPALVGLIAAISMLRASGALEFITRMLAPVTAFFKMPPEVLPLALLRPVSGSGALAVVNDIFKAHGADSLVGYTASVMMGSTETTFYTLTVYFGAVGIKDARYALKAALIADFVGMVASCLVCRMFF